MKFKELEKLKNMDNFFNYILNIGDEKNDFTS